MSATGDGKGRASEVVHLGPVGASEVRRDDLPRVWLDVGGHAWASDYNDSREPLVRADLADRLRAALVDVLEMSRRTIGAHDVGGGPTGKVTHRFAGDGERTGCRYCRVLAAARLALAEYEGSET